MPAYPLPQRPGTQGSTRDRNPGLSFLSGSALDTKGRGATGVGRGISTASGGARPPLPGGPSGSSFGSTYAHVSGTTSSGTSGGGSTSIPPLFNQPAKRLNTAPTGASRPAPPPRGRMESSLPIPQVGGLTSSGGGSKHRVSSGSMRRPPSSGTIHGRQTVQLDRTSCATTAGTGKKDDFHKGLVTALHEVLKKQRHGVFPQPVTNNEVEAMRSEVLQQQTQAQHDARDFAQRETTPQMRPGTGESQGSRRRDDDVEALIRQRKMQWAQNRWRNVRDQERKEGERKEAFVQGGSSPGLHGGIARGYRVDTPTRMAYEESDDFLDDDTIALLHNLERMERNSRQVVLANESKKMKELERRMDQIATVTLTATGSEATDSSSDSLASTPTGGADSLKAEGNRHYEAGAYYQAHRCYTRALELDATNPFLLTNRAACNMSLLNYDAVIKDCMKAVQLDPHLVKGYARMAHAYALQGHVRQATRHYASAIHYGSMQGSTILGRVKEEVGAVETLEKAKQLQAADNHEQVVQLLDAAFPFVGDPPVALIRLRSLIVLEPSAARGDITKLLQSLEHPACCTAAQGSQEGLILYNSVTFYADVLVLAAKASFYCGQHHINIAKQHLAQCLSLRRDHRVAMALEKSLNLFEQRFQQAAQCHQQNRFSDAHSAYTQVLAVDPENKKLLSAVYMCRAEVSQRLANVPAVISDCSSALDCDPGNFKALCRRAKCFGDIGDFVRAVRDLERAVGINPAVQEDLDEMKAKQQADMNAGSEFFGRGQSRPGSGANFGAGARSRPQSGAGTAGGGGVFFNGRCHYTILGLPRFVDVNMIRQQYRKLTLRYHPDKCVNETSEERKKSEFRFKEISSSYSALNDDDQKRLYDNALRTAA